MCEYSENLSKIPGIAHGFFDNSFGNMSTKVPDRLSYVIRNRLSAMHYLNLNNNTFILAPLEHTNNVLFIDKNNLNSYSQESYDALVTNLENVVLAVTYADCVPIIMATEKGSIIAIIHAGWRGIQQNIIKNTIDLIRANTTESLYASIGPCISQESFMVEKDVADRFTIYNEDININNNKYFINLLNIVIKQIKNENINNIDKVGGYTDKDLQKYFSYRIQKNKSGRHMALVSKSKL